MKVNGVALGPGSPLLTTGQRRRLLAPSEAEEQKALVELLLGRFWEGGGDRRAGLGMTTRHPELLLLYAINPNKGGQRSRAARGMAKAMGQLKGMPDLCLPVARCGYYALYVEMKRDGGRTDAGQELLHAALRAEHNLVVVCSGVERASRLVLGYLKGEYERA